MKKLYRTTGKIKEAVEITPTKIKYFEIGQDGSEKLVRFEWVGLKFDSDIDARISFERRGFKSRKQELA